MTILKIGLNRATHSNVRPIDPVVWAAAQRSVAPLGHLCGANTLQHPAVLSKVQTEYERMMMERVR